MSNVGAFSADGDESSRFGLDLGRAHIDERRKEVFRRLREELPAHMIDYYSRPDSSDGAIRMEKYRRQIYTDPSLKEFRMPPGVLMSADIGAVYGRWLKAQAAKSHVWSDNPVAAGRRAMAKHGVVVDTQRH